MGEKLSKVGFPALNRGAHFLKVPCSVVNLSNPAERALCVVQQALDHVRSDAQLGEPGCERPAHVMERPPFYRALFVEPILGARKSAEGRELLPIATSREEQKRVR